MHSLIPYPSFPPKSAQKVYLVRGWLTFSCKAHLAEFSLISLSFANPLALCTHCWKLGSYCVFDVSFFLPCALASVPQSLVDLAFFVCFHPNGSIADSSALHNSEGQFSRQQNTPQTSDQVQSIGGAATVNHVAAFTQSSPSAVSDKGHFNLEIPTATNPENGKRTATCPLEGCHRTYEGPNSKRICRSHITE